MRRKRYCEICGKPLRSRRKYCSECRPWGTSPPSSPFGGRGRKQDDLIVLMIIVVGIAVMIYAITTAIHNWFITNFYPIMIIISAIVLLAPDILKKLKEKYNIIINDDIILFLKYFPPLGFIISIITYLLANSFTGFEYKFIVWTGLLLIIWAPINYVKHVKSKEKKVNIFVMITILLIPIIIVVGLPYALTPDLRGTNTTIENEIATNVTNSDATVDDSIIVKETQKHILTCAEIGNFYTCKSNNREELLQICRDVCISRGLGAVDKENPNVLSEHRLLCVCTGYDQTLGRTAIYHLGAIFNSEGNLEYVDKVR